MVVNRFFQEILLSTKGDQPETALEMVKAKNAVLFPQEFNSKTKELSIIPHVWFGQNPKYRQATTGQMETMSFCSTKLRLISSYRSSLISSRLCLTN